MNRRNVFRWLAGVALAPIAAKATEFKPEAVVGDNAPIGIMTKDLGNGWVRVIVNDQGDVVPLK